MKPSRINDTAIFDPATVSLEQRFPVSLSVLAETLFIPLWARACDSQQPEPVLNDPYAATMLQELDYDTSRFSDADATRVGCALRTWRFDRVIHQWLEQHPQGCIVELGVGLDRRYERLRTLGMPETTRLIEVDMPDVMRLRRHFVAPRNNRVLMAGDLRTAGFQQRVVGACEGRPMLLVAEGVFPYWQQAEIRHLLRAFGERGTQVHALFDVIGSAFMPFQRWHDAHRHVAARFVWSLPSLATLTRWSPTYAIDGRWTLWDCEESVRQQYPRWFALPLRMCPPLRRLYQFVLLRLAGEHL